jgi:hypothetical protein
MLRRGLAVAVVLLVLVVGAVLFVVLHSPGNVSHPNLSFTGPKVTPRPKSQPVAYFIWPRYGYDAARTHVFPNSRGLDPPLRQGWAYRGGSLLEFSPVIYGNSLFMLNDDGLAFALDKRNGRMLWQDKVGPQSAAGSCSFPCSRRSRMLARARTPGRANSSPCPRRTGASCGRATSPPGLSPPRSSGARPSISATRAGPCTR